MQINPNTGFFDVQPGETITICVTAINTGFVATFSDPTCANWLSTPGPTNGKECRQFVAPATGSCVVVITLTFQPDATGAVPAGAQYSIDISGSAGGSFHKSVVPPPNVQAPPFTFVI